MSLLQPHFYPQSVSRSSIYKVKADGVSLDVLSHPAADHTSLECGGRIQVEIETVETFEKVLIHPLSLDVHAEVKGNRIQFTFHAPQNIQVEIEGRHLLYIYALPPMEEAPTGPKVRRFLAGQIYEAGLVILDRDEICWIDAGAIVRGSIRSYYANNVRVGGYGILDGSYWTEHEGKRRKAMVLDHCNNARVENILMLGPSHWMLSLGACHDVTVSGIRQIANDVSSDGIDICGSTRIRVTGCCLHNGDDNIAIKAIGNTSGRKERESLGLPFEDWKGTVEDIVVSNCIFHNLLGGSAMEIGYETSTDHIRNIRFEKIDVLAVHEFGSVFGIHNGDRARVENVVWDDVRVDHHFDMLVDFRVVNSRWNHDPTRGFIHNILVQNIKAKQTPSNEGYTLSAICGYDAEHPVTSVTFGKFELGGRLITNADELSLATRHAHSIRFLGAAAETEALQALVPPLVHSH